MMMNLFSIFDPSCFSLSMAWLTTLCPMIILMKSKFMSKNKWQKIINNIYSSIFKEMKPILGKTVKKGITLSLLAIFKNLSIINFVALTPFLFTPTAHLNYSFTTALTIWLAMMLFGWFNKTKNMMAHMVPNGTPLILMNFMVLIEMVSNMIRPITLAVRLSANMVAGHLMMSLLSNFALTSKINMMSSSLILIILSILEITVAFIQAYVFATLMTLYSTEIHYGK